MCEIAYSDPTVQYWKQSIQPSFSKPPQKYHPSIFFGTSGELDFVDGAETIITGRYNQTIKAIYIADTNRIPLDAGQDNGSKYKVLTISAIALLMVDPNGLTDLVTSDPWLKNAHIAKETGSVGKLQSGSKNTSSFLFDGVWVSFVDFHEL